MKTRVEGVCGVGTNNYKRVDRECAEFEPCNCQEYRLMIGVSGNVLHMQAGHQRAKLQLHTYSRTRHTTTSHGNDTVPSWNILLSNLSRTLIETDGINKCPKFYFSK